MNTAPSGTLREQKSPYRGWREIPPPGFHRLSAREPMVRTMTNAFFLGRRQLEADGVARGRQGPHGAFWRGPEFTKTWLNRPGPTRSERAGRNTANGYSWRPHMSMSFEYWIGGIDTLGIGDDISRDYRTGCAYVRFFRRRYNV